MSLKKPKTNILTFFKPRSQKNEVFESNNAAISYIDDPIPDADQVLDKDMSGNVNSASTCINYAEEPIPEQFEEIIEGSNEVNPILNPDDLEQIMSKQPNIDALRTRLKYKHTTEKEIEIPIGTWLSHSPFRLKKIEDKSHNKYLPTKEEN